MRQLSGKQINDYILTTLIFVAVHFDVMALHPAARDTIDLQNITITASAVGTKDPVTFQLLNRKTIETAHYGQDPSEFLQNAVPSILAYGDGGTPIGNYVQFRIRGMDQSRTNISLNGVPLNDMIDQGVFFSNFSDLNSSASAIQIQRGVGVTNGGLSSYAGTISFESPRLFDHGLSGRFETLFGSFGTGRLRASVNTGLMPNGTAFHTRLSRTVTSGFKNHAGSDAYSLFVSGGYMGARDVIRLTALAGKTQNDQAYLPVLLGDIEEDPKTNYNHPNDTDDFEQELAMIQHTRYINSQLKTSNSLYFGSARGIFPFGLDDTTQILYGLKNQHVGWISEWRYETNHLTLTAGTHLYKFDRKNQNFTAPNTTVPDYEDKTEKEEISVFLKTVYTAGKWSFEGDLQYRHINLLFESEQILSFGLPVPTGNFEQGRNWSFFNPRFGLSLDLDDKGLFYASLGYTSREPTRTDLLQGDGSSINAFNYQSVLNPEAVRKEDVLDLELGWRLDTEKTSVLFNVFHMSFDNEITQVGALAARSYVPLRRNVPESRRSGLEVQAKWHPSTKWTVNLQATYMHTNISRFEDDNDVYRDVNHIFAPDWNISPGLTFHYQTESRLSLNSRYVSRSFMELSNDRDFILPGYGVIDFQWQHRFSPHFSGRLILGNLTNNIYYNDGAPVDLDFDGVSEGPGYRIQAPRHWYLSAQYTF